MLDVSGEKHNRFCHTVLKPFKFINSFKKLFTVFTRLSDTALFKFSELQMRRSFGGGAL
jgi:hypothetical protein